MELRYYQREAIDAVNSGVFEFNSGILALGTGAGKTAIVAKDIAQVKGRCLMLSDQDELISQPVRAFQRISGVIAAIEKGKLRASPNARVVVASAQTLIKKERRERFRPDHFKRIYIDEAHRGSKRNKEISDYYSGAQIVGLTATPFRQGLRDLSEFYDTVFYSKPMLDLCGEGWAPPIEWLPLPVEIDLEGVKESIGPDGKDYKAEDLDSTITPYLEAVAKLVAHHAKHRHIIAFLPLVKTSMEFAKALRNAGVTARHVDGSSPDREQIIEAFGRGHFSCLCNAGVISTGVDIPIADCYLNLRPLKSFSQYQQSAGRCLRTLPGLIDHLPEKEQAEERKSLIAWSDKNSCLILDPLWQHEKLGTVNPACLVSGSQEEAMEIAKRARREMSQEDLMELKRRVQAEKEQQVVRALERAAVQMDLRNAAPFEQAAYLIGNEKLRYYEPVARWELEPPSRAQLVALGRYGIAPDSVTTKGLANKLCEEMIHRTRNRFATIKQIRLLHQINEGRNPEARVQYPERLTVAEAAGIIDTDMAARKAARLVAA